MPRQLFKIDHDQRLVNPLFANVSCADVFCQSIDATDRDIRRWGGKKDKKNGMMKKEAVDRSDTEITAARRTERNRVKDRRKGRARIHGYQDPSELRGYGAMASDVISLANRASSHHIITRKMAHYYHYYFIFSVLQRGPETGGKQRKKKKEESSRN